MSLDKICIKAINSIQRVGRFQIIILARDYSRIYSHQCKECLKWQRLAFRVKNFKQLVISKTVGLANCNSSNHIVFIYETIYYWERRGRVRSILMEKSIKYPFYSKWQRNSEDCKPLHLTVVVPGLHNSFNLM